MTYRRPASGRAAPGPAGVGTAIARDTGRVSGQSPSVRVPRVAWLAWAFAVAVLAALVVAVSHYLATWSGGSTGSAGMAGHAHASTADALSRAGASTLRPLFGTALFTAWQL